MKPARQKEKIPGHAKAHAEAAHRTKIRCYKKKNWPIKYTEVCEGCYYCNSCSDYQKYLREKGND